MSTSQNILITGTNSGFGRLISLTLARSGHQVFATMRDVAGRNAGNAAELTALGEGRIHVVEMAPADDASVARAVGAVLDRAGHVDVLVNNAGFGVLGLAETITSEQLLEQYNVNVIGPHRVMRALLPSMRARAQGLVIQISSIAGRLSLPVMGAYCSSKFALEALSDAYRHELAHTGVEITSVQPGAFGTDFASRVHPGADHARAAEYGIMANALEGLFQNLGQIMSSSDAPSPQMVADTVLSLVQAPAGSRPERVVIDPMTGHLAETLNDKHVEVQALALEAFGMSPPRA